MGMKPLERLMIAWVEDRPGPPVENTMLAEIEAFGKGRGILSSDFVLKYSSITATLAGLREQGVIEHPGEGSRGWILTDLPEAQREAALLPTREKRARTLATASPEFLEAFRATEADRKLFSNSTRSGASDERESIFKQYEYKSAIGDYNGSSTPPFGVLRHVQRSHLAAEADYRALGLPINNSPANVLPEPIEVNEARVYGKVSIEEDGGRLVYRIGEDVPPHFVLWNGKEVWVPKYFITKTGDRVPALPMVMRTVRFAKMQRSFVSGR
jgi:hypothetical protein